MTQKPGVTAPQKCEIPTEVLKKIVRDALAEDTGPGDVTSAIFDRKERGAAVFLAKQEGVLSGIDVAMMVFKTLDRGSVFLPVKKDGDSFRPGDVLAEVEASLRVLFTGERIALNFLQRMSGVATLTRRHVDALGSKSRLKVYDTRKTTPLLRVLEKKAVRDGGGQNHRLGLWDMAMLKNNHIDAAGGIGRAVLRLRDNGFFDRKDALPLCIEARNTDEAVEAAQCAADIVMLDNMTPAQMKKAVAAVQAVCKDLGRGMPEIEVSGGVTLRDIAKLKSLPVDRISIGALTHSAPAVDISMRFA